MLSVPKNEFELMLQETAKTIIGYKEEEYVDEYNDSIDDYNDIIAEDGELLSDDLLLTECPKDAFCLNDVNAWVWDEIETNWHWHDKQLEAIKEYGDINAIMFSTGEGEPHESIYEMLVNDMTRVLIEVMEDQKYAIH